MSSSHSAPRWFAAILANYKPEEYWDRDAGLFYRGLRANGVDARLAAIGDPSSNQREDLVLDSLAEMGRPDWWRQWNLDGVILYSWALPRLTPVAAAIKAAGLRLVLILDTGGYISPRVWPWMYFHLKCITERQLGPVFPRLRAALKTCVAAFKQRHSGLIRHLEHADFLVFPSTLARQRYSRFLKSWGRSDLAAKTRVVPHPVSEKMVYDPACPKQKRIIAVGGWHRLQKNTPGLVSTLARVLAEARSYSAQVIGPGTDHVEALVSGLPVELRERIEILGPVANDQLPGLYQPSQILFCPSHYESFHIPTGEALCCGCSFVGDARISSMPYFGSLAGSGTVSCNGNVRHISEALHADIELWEAGLRNPARISEAWIHELHPAVVARKVLNLS